MVDSLAEAKRLAEQILNRLDASEPLSQVLPAARRLAGLLGREVEAQWLTWESSGLPMPLSKVQGIDRAALLTYAGLHRVADFLGPLLTVSTGTPSEQSGDRLINQPIAVLESRKDLPTPSVSNPDFTLVLAERGLYPGCASCSRAR